MITAKKTTKKVIGYIKNTCFNIPYTTMSNCVMVTKKTGGYVLEFSVTYRQQFKNYVSANHFQPEEFDVNYEPTEINDVCLYLNSEVMDLDENLYSDIKNELENNILTL